MDDALTREMTFGALARAQCVDARSRALLTNAARAEFTLALALSSSARVARASPFVVIRAAPRRAKFDATRESTTTRQNANVEMRTSASSGRRKKRTHARALTLGARRLVDF